MQGSRGAPPSAAETTEQGGAIGPRRVDVLGVHVSPSTMAAAIAEARGWIDRRECRYVTFTGVHGVMEAQRDPTLLRIHNDAALVACDGVPLVWACRAAGVAGAERVYGPDFMLAFCREAASRGDRCFFYGGKEGVPELLAERLVARFPGLCVVGTHSPPFRALEPEEVAEEIAMINAARPDVVWVGLSTPKQERWMASRRERLDAPLLLGVGAAFDIHAGLVPQAPAWIQRCGLEWLFRLAVEPRRLWRRYLRNNPGFVWRILRERPRPVDDG